MKNYKQRVCELDDEKYKLQLLIRTLENKAISLEPESTIFQCTVDDIMKARGTIRILEQEKLALTKQHIKADLP